MFCATQIVHADVVVVFDPSTKEVYSLSKESDAVVPAGMEVKTIQGNPEDYYSQADAKDYKFDGDKLILNVKKINDREELRQQKQQKQDNDKALAIAKLKALGLTDDEIKILLK
jgi:Pyruvate/2-oxoacid:ferredoxin oxidoreductase gamma subunit